MSRRLRQLFAPIASVATAMTLVAGCGAASTSAAPAVPASSAAPSAGGAAQWAGGSFASPSGLQTYQSTQEIIDAAKAAGVSCLGLKNDSSPSIAVQQGRCQLNANEIVVAVYTSPAERDSATNQITGSLAAAGIQYGVLAGGNWMVNCNNELTCLKFRAALGGRMNSGEGK